MHRSLWKGAIEMILLVDCGKVGTQQGLSGLGGGGGRRECRQASSGGTMVPSIELMTKGMPWELSKNRECC